jgi:excisionase family DNA binding protein
MRRICYIIVLMAQRLEAQQLQLEVVPVERPEQPPQRRGANTPSRLGPRLALSPDEAAGLLGVSRDYLDEHVLGELRIVRRGRRILIALSELERWLDRAAARPALPSIGR